MLCIRACSQALLASVHEICINSRKALESLEPEKAPLVWMTVFDVQGATDSCQLKVCNLSRRRQDFTRILQILFKSFAGLPKDYVRRVRGCLGSALSHVSAGFRVQVCARRLWVLAHSGGA